MDARVRGHDGERKCAGMVFETTMLAHISLGANYFKPASTGVSGGLECARQSWPHSGVTCMMSNIVITPSPS